MNNRKISIAARALAIGMVAALMLVGTAMGEVTRTGLIAEYHFEGDAKDSSGYRNDGTIYGATFVQGMSGQALSFDGRNNGVKVTGSFTFSTSNQITIESWFKLTGHESHDGIVSSEGCCLYRLMVDPSLHPFYNPGAHTDLPVNTFTFETGKWYHYAMTIGSRTAKIYVDGSEISSSTRGVPATLPDITTFLIANGEEIGTWPAQAIIDEVRIYNRALSDSEIKAIYEAEKSFSQPKLTGGNKESALELINSVSSRIDILKRNNLDTSIIDQALKNAKDAYDFGKYDEAYPLAQNAQKMADDAYQSNQLINSAQSEIDGAKSINADVSKAENKLKEAKDALAKGDYQRAQSWANEAMQLAKHASIGTVSIKDMKALATKYDERSVVLSGTIRSIETVYGKGYKFAMDDGSGMISVVYQGSLGDIKDGEKITASGIFQASTGTIVADNVQKSGITSAPAFEVILAGIGILIAFVLRRR